MPDSESSAPPVAALSSCAEIARTLKCNTSTVWRAIARLGLQPKLKTSGGYCFYDDAAVETLRKTIRTRA